MIRQHDLVEKVKSYDPDADEDAINRAYEFALKAHGAQKRASGDPYFSHPVEVAYKLTRYKLDVASIITALLHDTVEDTEVTLDDVEANFGKEIRTLVDGVTKLSRLEGKSENLNQAENFRKLLIAMSEDLRVLLVKLADRLHNMETLNFIKSPEKRQRIARETVEIYAALAERIGMRGLKDELQDLAFAELYPEARESIVKRLDFLRKEGQAELDKTLSSIRRKLDEAGLKTVEIHGREKRPFSIWKKMENKNIEFEQLSDIIAFRIVTDTVAECYQALGVIHAEWHTIPGRFKDYISTPKSNGYQSLHTAVLGPGQQRVEIQIRTHEMDEIAEYGLAAHWAYKQTHKNMKDGKQFRWLRELLEILEKSSNPEEFLENTKLEMYHDQVFCFSPKGDILAFPRGATPVDFAYAVHSGVGDTCVGAKINGRIVPLRTKLKNGDQVEIITSKTQTPSPSWERFVVTGKAKSEIRKYVRTSQRAEYINLGRAVLVKTFKQEGHEFAESMVEPHLPAFNKKTVDDLLAEVGEGLISRQQVADVVIGEKKPAASPGLLSSLSNPFRKKKSGGHTPMPIKGLIPGMAIHFGGCCHPIPGDRIVGIVTTGKGITIHTMECETLENYSDAPERWIDVAWEHDQTDARHIGRLRAQVSHEPAALATVTNVIAKEMGNINNLKITNRSIDFFEILIDVEVRDLKHLNNIIANLRAKEVVQSVERYQT
ncbi:MAG: bifunctional (p)ppGpp synthetase/guanosine-3',5'-bis(diphosphate) 3'-pyrophosphohydrolase [Pseudomonadota bacterium]|nr:bifunctional (p)ppGpp synthetase/guanosine-3',5'-bis(diphosphate) 3'-pyrophosphohydrolase [Pseudomonadota bacterium]MDE3037051.1 bifunctional (p)ppGpp synthetase/guanosine-3',5'-bis(diphosphate) 3'-pyrophosphohydrolase [Pseudomonadota bacterium]